MSDKSNKDEIIIDNEGKSAKSKMYYDVLDIIKDISERQGVTIEEAGKVYRSMIGSIHKAIKEADFDHYDSAPKMSIPIIGKIVVSRNKYKKYLHKKLKDDGYKDFGV